MAKRPRRRLPAFIEYEYAADDLAAFFSGKCKRIRPCKVTRYVITPEAHARALRLMGLDPARFPLKEDKAS